jgi:hypothetical protein
MPLKPNAKKPFTCKATIGKIKVISDKGNLNILKPDLIRNLSEGGRAEGQPFTSLVLIESDGMPSKYNVKTPVAVMDALWDRALAGEVIDLTSYSGVNGRQLDTENDYDARTTVEKRPKKAEYASNAVKVQELEVWKRLMSRGVITNPAQSQK